MSKLLVILSLFLIASAMVNAETASKPALLSLEWITPVSGGVPFGSELTFEAYAFSTLSPLTILIQIEDSSGVLQEGDDRYGILRNSINAHKDTPLDDVHGDNYVDYLEEITITKDNYRKGGDYKVNFIAINADGSTTINNPLTFTISKSAPYYYSEIVIPTFDEDTTYTIPDLNAHFKDEEGDELEFTSTNSGHINVVITDSQAKLTPEADWYGTETIKFTAKEKDGMLSASSPDISVTVNSVDDPAEWQTLENKEIDEDTEETLIYSNLKTKCLDIDSDVIVTITSTHLHYELYFDNNDLKINNLEENYNGEETVIVDCNDVEASFNLNIKPVNDRPVIESYSIAKDMELGQQQTFTVIASDVDNTELYYKWYMNEVLQDETSNSFTYTASGSPGNRYVRVVVSDNELNALDSPSWHFNVYFENKLEIQRVLVNDVDIEEKETLTFDPGDEVNFFVEIKNLFEDIKIRDVVIYIDIYEIDNGEDISKESIEYTLDAGYVLGWKPSSLQIPESAQPGLYDVEIYVEGTDENENDHEDSFEFYIKVEVPENIPPNAIIDTPTENQTINVGDSVYFSGHGEDEDGIIVAYLWMFGDGRTSEEQNPGDVQFNTKGIYTVTFNVWDNDGASDPSYATVKITVKEEVPENNPPEVSIVQPKTNQVIYVGESVYFEGSAEDPENDTIISYEWDFGDGRTSNVLVPENVQYNNPGKYIVKFRVQDEHGAWSGFAMRTITVKSITPVPVEPEEPKITLAREKIHINTLQIINDVLQPGDLMLVALGFSNQDNYDMDGKITISIPDLAIRKRVKFNLDPKEKINEIIPLEIPYGKGEYYVMVTIYDGDISRTKYRFVNII